MDVRGIAVYVIRYIILPIFEINLGLTCARNTPYRNEYSLNLSSSKICKFLISIQELQVIIWTWGRRNLER